MSEYISRLIARSRSDLYRGLEFTQGYYHFTELITAALSEMEANIRRMEDLNMDLHAGMRALKELQK